MSKARYCTLGITLLVAGLWVHAACGQPAFPDNGPAIKETKEQRDTRMQWWRDARFGMFIHWGLYAVPAGEWEGKKIGSVGEWIMNNARIPVADYEKLAGQFNPVKYNARRWVQIAKAAGMKYIVITSKHHDGFCLWDSKVSSYTITKATPFQRDVIKELAQACEAEGVKLCFYHSIMDWHHPDAQAPNFPKYNGGPANPNFPRYVDTYLRPQLKELLGYGKIGILWFDGEWIADWNDKLGWQLYNELRAAQPDLIINNRIGKSRKGMQGMSGEATSPGDYGTPEQEIPATGMPGVDWESCMTMNDTWGFKKDDNHWKSTATIQHMLVDCTSKGGNFLLNVGPTAEGEIPAPSVERLAEVGKWMQANSASIYGAGSSPFKKLPWGKCTTKPGKLYLHVFDWPKDGKLVVPGLQNQVTKAYLLADPAKALAMTAAASGAKEIALPAAAPDTLDTVVVLEIEGTPEVAMTTLKPGADGRLVLAAADASLNGRTIQYEHGDGKDSIGFWTNVKDYPSWEFTLDQPGKYQVELTYATDKGSGGAELVISAGGQQVTAKTKETGSWTKYETEVIGTLEMPAGKVTLAVKAKTRPGVGVMNLKSVVLKRV